MLDLAQRIRDLSLSKSTHRIRPTTQDDPMIRKPDISLAGALLDWEPKVELQDGLLETIEWFRRNLQRGTGPGRFRRNQPRLGDPNLSLAGGSRKPVPRTNRTLSVAGAASADATTR